jgi:candicidin polyketide synthase FscE
MGDGETIGRRVHATPERHQGVADGKHGGERLPLPEDAVAVVGVSCRVPGAPDPAAFWELLRSGRSAISERPPDRGALDEEKIASGARFGGFLERIDGFDCAFFGISPREAAAMDPQQRLMLELSWEALEDAAIPPARLQESQTGVFVGSISTDYADLLNESGPGAQTRHAMTGLHRSMIANRVSYTLGLRGPSMTVDTGQSSSLVAVHLACESLRSGESALALACGVHLNISTASLLKASSFGGLSPDGRCSAFDASANGYVRGEGGGVVVLKPLSQALAAGDRVYCVIRGSAVNNDGGGEGLTAPNRAAQEEVLRLAYERARVERSEVQYVELHGTGTVLGDRVEAGALGAVLGSARTADRPLPVGSVKTNLGHLEGAAGVVGLIKAALCVSHGEIPPSLNFQQASPDMPLQALGLQVQQRLGSWPRAPRLAGVSSFGLGGTNCHVVIGEPPHIEAPLVADDGPLGTGSLAWLVSGRGEPALRAQALRLAEHLQANADLSADAVGHSLARDRHAFEWRGVLLGADCEELLLATRTLARGESAASVVSGRVSGVGERPVFVFAGQGSQWEGMALELLDCSPVFATRMQACEEALGEYVQWSLRDVLRGSDGAPELDRLDVVQPVLFAVMVSLSALWRACGVHPVAVVGHSQGEIAAAHVAGALSLKDAARIVTARSEALKGLSGQGVMASVALSASEAEARIERWEGRVWVAAVNGPSSVVVSGDRDALGELLEECVAAGARVREIPAAVAAGHSPQVEALREGLLASLGDVRPHTGDVPFYSTVAGSSLEHERLDADYWYRNLREPVQLEATVRALLGDGNRAFLEVSSHPLLTGGVQETVDATLGEREDALVASTLRKGEGGPSRFLRSLATLWVNGIGVDWESALGATHASRVALPTYAFQRERHWLGAPAPSESGSESANALSTESGSERSGEAVGPTRAPAPVSLGASPTSIQSAFAQHLARVPARRQESVVLEMVLREAMVVLGYRSLETLPAERTFKELGFDSAAGVELRNRIAATTGLRLPTGIAFDYPTPGALAGHLVGELTGSVGLSVSAGLSRTLDEPIAIVGMSCRYPGGVSSPEELWKLVVDGVDGISAFPGERGWDLDALYDPDPDRPGTTYTRTGGFLNGATDFDAAFFGIGPREAMAMDPEQRLLLEASWEAIEYAGLEPRSLKGTQTGVFAGIGASDYGFAAGGDAQRDREGYLMTGTAGSVVSGRIAYTFGLEGPAVTVDTACSSSLVALHLACQALRSGDCSLALAGGVTVLSSPGVFVEFSRQRGLSVDGRCKAFADSADGTGWGEGVGVLLLARLSDALRDGHRVLAVVRGSAVNQDGASNGLTAPNGPAQQRVIGQALASAGLSPAEIDAVEGHGTGTTLGDPIEAQALLATYGEGRGESPLWLGSVKSNIGHTQAAAGVAGVIKMAMAMRHGMLPRTLHVDRPSSKVDWDDGKVRLLSEEVPWEAGGRTRRAGVSSFGISGTNAHVILEEPPPSEPSTREDAPGLGIVPWVLSGRGRDALCEQARRLSGFVEDDPDLDVVDVGFSLACRSSHEDRLVLLGASRKELTSALGAFADGRVAAGAIDGAVGEGGAGGLAFLFTGQGAQRVGMGQGLYEELPAFRSAFDEVCGHLDGYLGRSLREVVFAERPSADRSSPSEDEPRGEGSPSEDPRGPSPPGLLDETLFTQAGLFAIEVALFRLLDSLGVRPDYLIGHSVGELAAACVAGVFSLEDGCKLVAARGRLMGELPRGGAMVAVEASEAEALAELGAYEDRVSLAAINTHGSVVLSGEEDAVLELAGLWEERRRKTKRLRVSHAFHSARMEGMLEEFRRVCEEVSFGEPEIPIASNATGGEVPTDFSSPDYWVRQVRETVRFAEGIDWLDAQGVRSYLELGPDGVLSAMAHACAEGLHEDAPDAGAVVAAPVLRAERSESEALLDALARVWVAGIEVGWPALFKRGAAQPVQLPTYAFQRKRYWPDASQASPRDAMSLGLVSAEHPLLGGVVALADGRGWLFTGRVSLRSHPWLSDHALAGSAVLPGTAFVELALRAGSEVGSRTLEELTQEAPLLISEQGGVQLQVSVGLPDARGRSAIEIYSRPTALDREDSDDGESWTRHASGTLADGAPTSAVGGSVPAQPEWPPANAVAVDIEDLYERLSESGLEYGTAFQGLRAAWRGGEELFAEVSLPDERRDDASHFMLHPALLDAALHALGIDAQGQAPPIPFCWSGVRVHTVGASALRVRLSPAGADTVSIALTDDSGNPIANVQSLVSRAVSLDALRKTAQQSHDSLYSIEWARVPELVAEDRELDGWVRLGHGAWTPTEGIERHSDIQSLRGAIEGGSQPPQVVVLDLSAPRELDGGVGDSAQASVIAATGVLQEWLADERFAESRMLVLTSGAVRARAGERLSDLAGAAVCGLVRSAQLENPGRLLLVDTDALELSLVALDAALASEEPQVAVRDGALWAPRLESSRSANGQLTPPADVSAWQLKAGDEGTLDDLSLVEAPHLERELGSGEVRVGLRAAGLNFRDVLIALGLYPGPASVGGEGAGVVLEVAPDVAGLRPGDRVMGLMEGAFGPVAIAEERLLAHVPDGWSFAQAASVPIAFLTAYRALVDLASLGEGERLLVHAAAGGVGMAAVQLAEHLGAEVFGTASPSKWDVLGQMGLDEQHVASSRDLEFGESFRQATDGRGMDVVLDCLAGEFVDESLGLLSDGGRFVEMGKADIRDPDEVAEDHPGVSYRAFDLMEVEPERIQGMLAELLVLFEKGVLRPLPLTAWDLRRAPEAFRFMSQARHVGKNVLTLAARSWEEEGTVLVTGGTGGLGGLLAEHLASKHGVRRLLLTSRRGLQAEGAEELLERLAELGARAEIVSCDVAERSQLEAMLDGIDPDHPLVAVVHAAGVLDDGVLHSLTPERVRDVLAPKVDGAWNLHEATRELDLQAFLMFSSIAGSLGSAGQASYAAANSFLDALAEQRRAQGLPAVSLAWGPWARVGGMADSVGEADRARLASSGVAMLTAEHGLELFDEGHRGAESLALAVRLDKGALRRQATEGRLPSLLKGLVRVPLRRAGSRAGSLARRVAGVAESQRGQVVLELVRASAAAVLGHASAEAIPPQRTFKDLGFDSLGAVELRNSLAVESGLRLPATLIFDHPTPRALADFLLGKLAGTSRPASQSARPAALVSQAKTDDPIAIVGMSCSLPGGVRSPDDLWELVASGGDAIAEFPSDRGWDADVFYDPDPDRSGTCYAREGGFVYDAADFDAAFFGISPREALAMDPQHRMFLEGCWEAVEHAGIDPLALKGTSTGVFAGCNIRDYNTGLALARNGMEGHNMTGMAGSILSGRVAYTLGLEGPAVTLDTACSSSLVALHMACTALRSGDCSLALAGGVTVLASPGLFIAFCRQRALAPDGRCKSFAEAADGTGWGEGSGVVLLERLSEARARGHRVLAVVRGSSMNQDGATNGLTAPSGFAQQQAVLQALADARLSPEDVDVVEAHGTGTELGDPIEAQALIATYGQRPAERPLWLGSIKSNIGHTQAAAGVAGVIKMVMAMRHGLMPKTLHLDRPTSEVDWSAGAVSLLSEEVPWANGERPRRAGVSSYGISGTNAHVILEQVEELVEPQGEGTEEDLWKADLVPWVVSARGESALRAQVGRLQAFALSKSDLRPQDVARSLAARSAFEHRAVVLDSSRDGLLAGLGTLVGAEPGRNGGCALRGVKHRESATAFLFTGQGAQRVGMGRELYDAFPIFRAAFDASCAHFDELLGCSLREVVFGEGEHAGLDAPGESLLDRTLYTQTGLFTLEVAMFRLLEAWGVRPDYLIGHSIGELAAAHVAGVFTLEDACRLVAARGRLMGELPDGGAMVAVQASEAEVSSWLAEDGDRVALAGVNGPTAVVLSGDEDAVLEAARAWEQRGRKTKQLRVSHAFHSARMDPMLDSFRRVAETVSFSEPTIPLVSNLTGELADAQELCTATYWVSHVRGTVRFAAGAQWLGAQGVDNFLELGPDGVLSAMAKECCSEGESDGAPVAGPLLKSGRPETPTLLEALAQAWIAGMDVGWEQMAAHAGGRRVEIPTYAFQRERYWALWLKDYWLDEDRDLMTGLPDGRSDELSGDGELWQAVEREDLDALACELGVDDEDWRSSLELVLPSLSAWRRRRSTELKVERWLYSVRWRPVTEESPGKLSGLWPVIVPRTAAGRQAAEGVVGALEAGGAQAVAIEVDLDVLDRGSLVERLSEAIGEALPDSDRVGGGAGHEDSARPAVGGVLSLLALEEGRSGASEAVPRGLMGTLLVAQALEDLELAGPLWVATRRAVAVGSADRIDSPEQGMVWGLGRVIGLEQPGRWGGLVDLPDVVDERAGSRLCSVLAGLGDEDQLAIRSAGTFARRLARAHLRDAPAESGWRPEGTVLVTGGTGGLGGHVARWLAGMGAEHLLLVSRRGPAAPGVEELTAELEGLGARVTVAACDVADRRQLQELLLALPEEQPLRAVIHAAGVIAEEPVGELTVERLGEEIASKADGALALHELTAQMELSAFVMFSSIAGVFGSAGQAGYAAGNAYLTSLAEHRRDLGLTATSIAWGAWAGEGMAEGAGEQLNRRGIQEMQPELALGALRQALDRDETFLTVADLDWERYAVAYTAARPRPLIEEIAEAQSALAQTDVVSVEAGGEEGLVARLSGLSSEERERMVLDVVRSHTAGVLGYRSPEEVEVKLAFKEFGIDSLAAVDLRNRLQGELGSRLPTTIVFDYPTPLELARYLIEEVVGEPKDVVVSAGVVRTTDEPIAIVGMGCRFPGGVQSPEQLWELVSRGVDAISPFPTDRGWDLEGIYDFDPDHRGTTYVREGGFLHDAADFDADFFGISPREALAMNPQQRLLLEVCWEALESANIDPRSLKGSQAGVFVGESFSDYGGGQLALASKEVKGYLATGSAGAVVSGRVSYLLGLEGPAMTVNTACSSALVALHLAVGALRGGECSLAMAGGATVMATPGVFIAFSPQRGLAADGRCKSFADTADGTGWSEGVGMVVVERLSDAQRNGHEVLAVIRGSAVNQDGASNGLTAPNGLSQQRVIMQALANAGLSPTEVDAVEAHGTGTRLGDPIEAQALLSTYGAERDRDRPLWLGSVKSNIGHTQAAAGIAGVIKMVMALRHERLPRTLHVEEPSQQIDWSSGAISLLTEDVVWKRNGRPLRAGVSSFGISGTNSHLILEGPSPTTPSSSSSQAPDTSPLQAIPWMVSARGERALREQASQLRAHVRANPSLAAVDVGLSLASRSKLEHRAVILGGDRDALLDGLDALVEGRPAAEVLEGVSTRTGPTAFLFTGQGAQHAGMGSELYGAFPAFATALDECCELLDSHLECSLRELIFAAEGSSEAHRLDETAFTQASLFALEVALFRLLESWDLRPDYLLGHSIGELAAAHVSGVFSLRDACALVAARGRLMGALEGGGAMVAVQASEPEMLADIADAAIQRAVALAAVNGPSSVVVSGDEQEVLALAERWRERGRKTRRLRVSHAFHSARMDAMLEPFAEVASGISFDPPQIPLVSNLTGSAIGAKELCTADYWVRHVRETVRFADGIRWLDERGVRSFVELGPDGVLSAMAQECLSENASPGSGGSGDDPRVGDTDPLAGEPRAVAAGSLLRGGRGEVVTLFTALAGAFVAGTEVDWGRPLSELGASPVELPTYAFQRERFWLDSVEGSLDAGALGQTSATHPLLGAVVVLAEEEGRLFTGRLSVQTHPWLADHLVLGRVLFPGTAFVELALYCGSQLEGGTVRELTLQSPLLLPAQGAVQIQVKVGQADEVGVRSLTFHSRAEDGPEDARPDTGEWVCHAVGSLAPRDVADRAPFQADGVWPPAEAESVPIEDLYDRLADAGLDYGPVFQGLTGVWRREGELFAEVALPDAELEQAASFAVHPALLDAALHALALTVPADEVDPAEGVRLPFSWNEVTLLSRGASALRVRLSPTASEAISIEVSDQHGVPVASVGSLVMRSASTADIGRPTDMGEGLFCVEWTACPADGAATAGLAGSRWALLGEVDAALAAGCESAGVSLGAYGDLSSLGEAIESGQDAMPEVVLVDCRAPRRDLPADVQAGVAYALGVLQEWLESERLGHARLVFLTAGAVAAGEQEDVHSPVAAAMWGLVRSAQSENPGRLVLVDVDVEPSSAGALAGALGLDEPQVAIRGGEALVARLARAGSDGLLVAPSEVPRWRLDSAGANTLEGLALVPCPEVERALERGEVRVGVRAGGMNFKDVLIALGMYPGGGTIGNEAAGVVLEVGAGVEGLVPGDRVMGLFAGAFGPVAITDSRLLAGIPEDWSFVEAAAVPLVFLTAYYALVDLADVQPRERLLVHSAAGGVGMAAAQLARHLGVEVFATASAGKWAVLEEQGLEATHIASSRDLDFRERFLGETAGRGVDVVLNSLAREFVDASLELLPRGGRFVEMGKTDVRDPAEVAGAHEGVLYRAFDLMDAGAERIAEMLASLVDLFERGVLELPPIRVWDVRRAPQAMRFMSQARHVGKIVLTVPVSRSGDEGTVLITGGTGGLGAVLARHMVVDRGVRNLLLVSRAGEAAPGASLLREDLSGLGASVRIASCDVSDREQLKALIDSIPADAPLHGVVHAAGVLDDGTIGSLTPERVARVLTPKVDGAWHLHELTAGLDLDTFVLFSSVAATLGGPGQGNYAAANAFMDALAAHRRTLGLPAIAMAWGPWEQETGMTSQLDEADLARMASWGMLTLSHERGLECFEKARATDRAQLVLAHLDTAALRARARGEELPELLQGLVRVPARQRGASPDRSETLAASLAQAPPSERGRIVLELLRAQTAAVLGYRSSDAVDSTRTFKELGFDSLAAVELRNRLIAASGLQLSATLIFDYPTLEALAGFLLEEMVAETNGAPADLDVDLDKLQVALSSMPAEVARRSGVAARLQGILSAWASEAEVSEAEGGQEEDLESVTDDEIFELIDREFGVS